MASGITTTISQSKSQLDELLTSNPEMEKKIQSIVRKVLAKVSAKIEAAAGQSIKSDPRHAAKAVKTAVYRRLLGGNVSILNRKKASGMGGYEPPRTLRNGQRGGNRRSRSARTQQIMSYEGRDRAFILRFINNGTQGRTIRNFSRNPDRASSRWTSNPNTGYRGQITARNFFPSTSQAAMESAVVFINQAIDELIQQEMK